MERFTGTHCFECCKSVAEVCKWVEEREVGECRVCNSIAELKSGNKEIAVRLMREALGSVGETDKTFCYCMLRAVQCSLQLHGNLRSVTAEEAYSLTSVKINSYEEFKSTWMGFLHNKFRVGEYVNEATKVCLEIASKRRKHSDWKELEHAYKCAENSKAFQEHSTIAAKLIRATHGMQAVWDNVGVRGSSGKVLTEEAARKVLRSKEVTVANLREQKTAFEATPDYQEALQSINAYKECMHESGLDELLKKKIAVGKQHPPLSGDTFEKEVQATIRGLAADVIPLDGCEVRVLTNVVFTKLQMPEKLTTEFDAFVVHCRREEVEMDVPKKKQGGAAKEVKAKLIVQYEVVRMEGWYEVKLNADDIINAITKHSRARKHLLTLSKDVFCENEGIRYKFPIRVFERLGDTPATFVTLAGPRSALTGSDVPPNICFPASLSTTLFQWFLDTLAPSLDPTDLANNISYLPALYDRLGEFLMKCDSHESPAYYRALLFDSVRQLLETAEQGRILVMTDPYLEAFRDTLT
eukprot:TRINITY_DN12773_c0_g2_i1.p1 TRINITY_DN12773_c0_g2~~TRINITY_DN12773_c0_g2_i1.p1  ORF type:complete len:539 (+),score=111.90 TRINITY_DN12773_c0_g2_i1:45-1619(+)